MSKVNYSFISEQLTKLGWTLLSGNWVKPDSRWEHVKIKRTFSTYEAGLCHNLVVNISRMKPNQEIYPTYCNMLRLFADHWSIDGCKMEEEDVSININDSHVWWKQIHDGGRRMAFEKALLSIKDNDELDYYFLEYLSNTDLNRRVLPEQPTFAEDGKLALDVKPGFILDVASGVTEADIRQALKTLGNEELKKDLSAFNERFAELRKAITQAQEALDRVLSTAGVSSDEKTD